LPIIPIVMVVSWNIVKFFVCTKLSLDYGRFSGETSRSEDSILRKLFYQACFKLLGCLKLWGGF
jgi:hypothetical protein